MSGYEGKVVVITGASDGIGAALAEEVAQRGGRVVLAARRRDKLEALAARLGGGALAVPTDVTRRSEVEALRDQALAAAGRIDIWVNNVGRGITRMIGELTDDDVDAMVRDNVKSALYGMQAVLPHFRERGDGVVVNVSSMLGRVPFVPFRAAYSASKAALNSLTESLRGELRQKFPGIRVVLVLPGVVATEFGKNALHGGVDSRALPDPQSAADVARVVADGMLTRNGDIYTRPDGAEVVLRHFKQLGGPN